MKYKALFLRDLHESGKKLLQEHDCEVVIARSLKLEEYRDQLEACDAVFVRNEPVTAEMMDLAPNLKVVAKHGVGYDNIDVAYATKKGIQVVYAPTGNINSVAEMTMLHILSCARRLRHSQEEFIKGNYNVRFQMNDTHEIEGKTLALIGCGNIARLVAKKAVYGFGMRVIGYDPFVKKKQLECGIEMIEDRDQVFAEADFVSIHLPSLPDTIHSIGKREFQLMKPTAYLINTARGNLICEEELIEALKTGEIAGAGLDVYEEEPPAADNPLLFMDQVNVTPHCGGLTVEASERLSYTGAKGILEVLYHEPLTWPVNQVRDDG